MTETLAKRALDYFDIYENLISASEINRKCFRICTDVHCYILKKYETMYMHCIDNNLKAFRQISGTGMKAPELIRNKKGEYYFRDGEYIYILYTMIEGITLSVHTAGETEMLELARCYALVVTALKGCGFTRANEFYQEQSELNGQYEDAMHLLSLTDDTQMQDILRWKMAVIQELREQGSEYIDELTWTESHGDFYISQLLFDETGKICGILDFDTAAIMPTAYEVLRCFYMGISLDMEDAQRRALLKRYIQVLKESNVLENKDIKFMFDILFRKLAVTLYGCRQYILEQDASMKLEAVKLRDLAKMVMKDKNFFAEVSQ